MQEKQFIPNYFVICSFKIENRILLVSKFSQIGELNIESDNFQLDYYLERHCYYSLDFINDCSKLEIVRQNVAYLLDIENETEKIITENVWLVRTSGDDQWAFTCSASSPQTLILWNLETNQKVNELKIDSSEFKNVSFYNNASNAISVSNDNTVILWDLKNFKEEFKFTEQKYNINFLSIIHEKKLLISIDAKTIIIWNLSDGSIYAVLSYEYKYDIYKLCVTRDRKFIYSGNPFDGMVIWNIEEKQKVFQFNYKDQAASWLKEHRILFSSVRCCFMVK